MTPGHVYVLVNSSMPGLVKVGKTTRSPLERAEELSGATGVAAPFVLAFQQEFTDCDAAEKVIHNELARQGLRPSTNREFFRAPTDTVIRAVLKAADAMAGIENSVAASSTPQLEQFKTSGTSPWRDLLQQGIQHYYGFDECLEDRDLGLSYFEDAAKLGSLDAYSFIGHYYKDDGQNELAINHYRRGAKLHNYYCYAAMGRVYAALGHAQNFEKSYALFFEERKSFFSDELERSDAFQYACMIYLGGCQTLNLPFAHAEDMRPAATAIMLKLENHISECKDGGNQKQSEKMEDQLIWFRRYVIDVGPLVSSLAPRTVRPLKSRYVNKYKVT